MAVVQRNGVVPYFVEATPATEDIDYAIAGIPPLPPVPTRETRIITDAPPESRVPWAFVIASVWLTAAGLVLVHFALGLR